MAQGSNNGKARAKRASQDRPTGGGQRLALTAVGALLLLALALVAAALAGNAARPAGEPASSATTEATGKADIPAASPGARAVAGKEKIGAAGVEVEFSVQPVDRAGGTSAGAAFELAELRFALSDPASGAPLQPEQRPAVWVDLEKAGRAEDGRQALTCQDKVRLYAQGTLSFRPDIDLNSYFVMALNQDATVSVIDPLVGVSGISQLYAMAFLSRPGEDWALLDEQSRLFVTMPQAGAVAAVDTNSFKVLKNVTVGTNPVRIAAQPDGRYLWVGVDAPDRRESGVAVIDPHTLEVVARIPTGAGHHEIAFSGRGAAHGHSAEERAAGHDADSAAGDGGYAFVTNRDDGTLSVIDRGTLKKVKDIKVGRLPVALDFSTASNAVYVAHEGGIAVVDAGRIEPGGRIDAGPGLKALRFAPGGRWGFTLDEPRALVAVFDASTNRLVHSSPVGAAPDQLAFTATYAYVRSRGTAEVTIVDLAQLGKAETLPVLQIIAGQRPPAESPFRSVAAAIFPSHGSHVLIANPAENYIYYYMEGMKAPMGGFQNYNRAPRAVRVLDRGIREVAPGTYSAKVKLPAGGRYQAAFLLDSPRVVHCFSFAAEADPAVEAPREQTPLRAEFLAKKGVARPGERFGVRVKLTDARKEEPVSGLRDVQLIASHVSGQWQQRYPALPLGDGVYEATLAVPRQGLYNVFLAVPSQGVAFNQLPSFTLRVAAAEKAP